MVDLKYLSERAAASERETVNEQLERFYKKAVELSEQGKWELSTTTLTQTTRAELKRQGFKIKEWREYNFIPCDTYYFISWRPRSWLWRLFHAKKASKLPIARTK